MSAPADFDRIYTGDLGHERPGGHGFGVYVGVGGNGERLDAFHHHLAGLPGQAAGRVQIEYYRARLLLLRSFQDAVHEAEALFAGQGVLPYGDDDYPVAEGFLRGRPEGGAGKQGQQSQQQKVNALHADRLACSAPALNGEMCSSGAGSRRCCAVFSLPVEALFPRMAFRFCILVHPYPL